MRKIGIRIVYIIISYFSLITCLQAQEEVLFDKKDLAKGIIHIAYQGETEAKLKLMIEKDSKKYTYDLSNKGKRETFPLQLGNGKYKVSVLKNIKGTSYAMVEAATIERALKDEKVVYLTAIQNIDWTMSSKPVKKAIELTKNTKSVEKKAEILYKYVVQSYLYDYGKLETLSSNYIPSIDQTYDEEKGICYDFASLFAAILRSQGIPSKLIKGYSPNAEGYHAWNEVYDEGEDKWLIIDTTYDLQIIKKKSDIQMVKLEKDYQKVNEY